MVLDPSGWIPRVRRTQGPSRFLLRFRLRGFHPLRHNFPVILTTFLFSFIDGPITPTYVGLAPSLSLATTQKIVLTFFSFRYLDVSVPLSLPSICARSGYTPFLVYGFPHSDIAGSLSAYDSPTRFAVCCVLLRLDVPRHPPDALASLTFPFGLLSRLLSSFRLSEKISLSLLSIVSLIFSFQCSLPVSSRTLKTKTYPLLNFFSFLLLPRKEVIHPHVPVGIPCYDFTPIIKPTFDSSFLSVRHRLRVFSTLMV